MPDGYNTYSSFVGSVLSIVTFVIILMYGSYKLTKLIDGQDFRVRVHTHENEFATNSTFGMVDGFTVAAALTIFDGSNADITDPEVGELKFYLKRWDTSDEVSEKFTELKTKVCTREDLNYGQGDSEESKFFPISDNDKSSLSSYGAGKMQCLAEAEQLNMWGNYDSDKASNLMVVFEKCDVTKRAPGQKCKSEPEIEAWMEGKYMIILENQAKFVQHQFWSRKVNFDSKIKWFPLSYSSR